LEEWMKALKMECKMVQAMKQVKRKHSENLQEWMECKIEEKEWMVALKMDCKMEVQMRMMKWV
jgi:hypothetical protein